MPSDFISHQYEWLQVTYPIIQTICFLNAIAIPAFEKLSTSIQWLCQRKINLTKETSTHLEDNLLKETVSLALALWAIAALLSVMRLANIVAVRGWL